MKLFNIKLLCFLFILPLVAFAKNGIKKGKHQEEKRIHKEFKFVEGMLLNINNSYGNIDITAWDSDKIIIDVLVIVNGKNQAEAKQLINKIDVSYSLNLDDGIVTILTKKKTYKHHEYREIHYQVKVPKNCHLNIDNNYGDISIDESEASISLKTYYGNIKAGNLTGITKLETSFSQRNTVDYIKNGTIKGRFCDYRIKKAGTLDIVEMISSNGVINNVANLKYKCNYGSLMIDNINTSIDGKGEYLTTNIENCLATEKVKIEAYYGYVDVKNWNNKIASFDIDNAKLSIGYTENKPFNLNMSMIDCSTESILKGLSLGFTKKTLVIRKKNSSYSGYYLKNNETNFISLRITNGILRMKKVLPILQ